MTFWRSWTRWLPATPSTVNTTTDEATFNRLSDSLRLRLWLIVSIALLPVVALSVWQGVERLKLDEADVQDQLRQSALVAASDEQNIFSAGEQILRALANQESVRAGAPDCAHALGNAVAGLAFFPNIVRVDAQGRPLCSALPVPLNSDATKRDWWSEVKSRREFMITGPVFGEASKRRILVGVLPL